jgi:glycogen(starch) synthase
MSNKKNIVIASLLKPVNDTRMYEKIGLTLTDNPAYHIYIIGFRAPLPEQHPQITFYPLFSFKRLSIKRVLAQVKYAKYLLKVKPQLIIVNTPELLIVSLCYKILFGGKIIYDVLENYYRNITKTDVYPPVIRQLLGGAVRALEYLTRPFIDHFTLAERAYASEFTFTNKKSTIIENKFKLTKGHLEAISCLNNNRLHFIFSGTLANSTGVFEAVKLTKAFYRLDKSTRLIIIGFSAKESVLEKLLKAIEGHTYIKIVGGNTLIPHKEILKEISKAGTGLVCYPPSPSTENCIPTKMFEYAAFQLPMIVQNNKPWESFCIGYQAGITTNFSKPNNTAQLYHRLLSTKFYTNTNLFSSDFIWNTKEHTKYLNLVNILLTN